MWSPNEFVLCEQIKDFSLRCRLSTAAALHFYTTMNVPFCEMLRNSLLKIVHHLKAITCMQQSHMMLNHIALKSAYARNNIGRANQSPIYFFKLTSHDIFQDLTNTHSTKSIHSTPANNLNHERRTTPTLAKASRAQAGESRAGNNLLKKSCTKAGNLENRKKQCYPIPICKI